MNQCDWISKTTSRGQNSEMCCFFLKIDRSIWCTHIRRECEALTSMCFKSTFFQIFVYFTLGVLGAFVFLLVLVWLLWCVYYIWGFVCLFHLFLFAFFTGHLFGAAARQLWTNFVSSWKAEMLKFYRIIFPNFLFCKKHKYF